MKTMSLLLLALVSLASYSSFAGTDPENTKLKFTLVSNTERDCKLSLKEIKAFDNVSVGKRYLCAQLVDVNYEIDLAEFVELVETNKIVIQYAGKSAESLLEILAAWKAALSTTADDYTDPKEFLTKVTPWNFTLAEQTAEAVTITIANELTGKSVNFSVLMNQAKPKK